MVRRAPTNSLAETGHGLFTKITKITEITKKSTTSFLVVFVAFVIFVMARGRYFLFRISTPDTLPMQVSPE
jgi:hypothetical protein